jgi:hypothetical protein
MRLRNGIVLSSPTQNRRTRQSIEPESSNRLRRENRDNLITQPKRGSRSNRDIDRNLPVENLNVPIAVEHVPSQSEIVTPRSSSHPPLTQSRSTENLSLHPDNLVQLRTDDILQRTSTPTLSHHDRTSVNISSVPRVSIESPLVLDNNGSSNSDHSPIVPSESSLENSVFFSPEGISRKREYTHCQLYSTQEERRKAIAATRVDYKESTISETSPAIVHPNQENAESSVVKDNSRSIGGRASDLSDNSIVYTAQRYLSKDYTPRQHLYLTQQRSNVSRRISRSPDSPPLPPFPPIVPQSDQYLDQPLPPPPVIHENDSENQVTVKEHVTLSQIDHQSETDYSAPDQARHQSYLNFQEEDIKHQLLEEAQQAAQERELAAVELTRPTSTDHITFRSPVRQISSPLNRVVPTAVSHRERTNQTDYVEYSRRRINLSHQTVPGTDPRQRVVRPSSIERALAANTQLLPEGQINQSVLCHRSDTQRSNLRPSSPAVVRPLVATAETVPRNQQSVPPTPRRIDQNLPTRPHLSTSVIIQLPINRSRQGLETSRQSLINRTELSSVRAADRNISQHITDFRNHGTFRPETFGTGIYHPTPLARTTRDYPPIDVNQLLERIGRPQLSQVPPNISPSTRSRRQYSGTANVTNFVYPPRQSFPPASVASTSETEVSSSSSSHFSRTLEYQQIDPTVHPRNLDLVYGPFASPSSFPVPFPETPAVRRTLSTNPQHHIGINRPETPYCSNVRFPLPENDRTNFNIEMQELLSTLRAQARKNAEPGTFHGTLQEDFAEFLQIHELWADSCEMSEEQKKKDLAARMRDNALRLFVRLDPRDREGSLHRMKSALERALRNPAAKVGLANKFQYRKLLPKETVQDFHDELRKIYRQLYPDDQYPENSREFRQKFWFGLPAALRTAVMLRGTSMYDPFEIVLDHTLTAEATLQAEQLDTVASVQPVGGINATVDPMIRKVTQQWDSQLNARLGEMEKKRESLQEQFTDNLKALAAQVELATKPPVVQMVHPLPRTGIDTSETVQPSIVECQLCGYKGHKASTCRVKLPTQFAPSYRGNDTKAQNQGNSGSKFRSKTKGKKSGGRRYNTNEGEYNRNPGYDQGAYSGNQGASAHYIQQNGGGYQNSFPPVYGNNPDLVQLPFTPQYIVSSPGPSSQYTTVPTQSIHSITTTPIDRPSTPPYSPELPITSSHPSEIIQQLKSTQQTLQAEMGQLTKEFLNQTREFQDYRLATTSGPNMVPNVNPLDVICKHAIGALTPQDECLQSFTCPICKGMIDSYTELTFECLACDKLWCTICNHDNCCTRCPKETEPVLVLASHLESEDSDDSAVKDSKPISKEVIKNLTTGIGEVRITNDRIDSFISNKDDEEPKIMQTVRPSFESNFKEEGTTALSTLDNTVVSDDEFGCQNPEIQGREDWSSCRSDNSDELFTPNHKSPMETTQLVDKLGMKKTEQPFSFRQSSDQPNQASSISHPTYQRYGPASETPGKCKSCSILGQTHFPTISDVCDHTEADLDQAPTEHCIRSMLCPSCTKHSYSFTRLTYECLWCQMVWCTICNHDPCCMNCSDNIHFMTEGHYNKLTATQSMTRRKYHEKYEEPCFRIGPDREQALMKRREIKRCALDPLFFFSEQNMKPPEERQGTINQTGIKLDQPSGDSDTQITIQEGLSQETPNGSSSTNLQTDRKRSVTPLLLSPLSNTEILANVAIDKLEEIHETIRKVLGVVYQHSRQLDVMRREICQASSCQHLATPTYCRITVPETTVHRPPIPLPTGSNSKLIPSRQEDVNQPSREATPEIKRNKRIKRTRRGSEKGTSYFGLGPVLVICMIILWPMAMAHPTITRPARIVANYSRLGNTRATQTEIPFGSENPGRGSFLYHNENITTQYREELYRKLQIDHHPISWQYCGNARNGYAVQIPQTPECDLPGIGEEGSSLDTFHVQLWIPRTKPLLFGAYKCISIITTICTYTSLFNNKKILRHFNTERFPSAEECQIMFKTRRFGKQRIKKLSYRLWSTHIPIVPFYKWCCATMCTPIENVHIERGTIGTIDGHDLQSDLGKMASNCTIHDQACMDHTGGYIQWEVNKLPNICPYEDAGIFTAQKVDEFITVPSIQEVFVLTRRYAPLCTTPASPYTRLSTQGVGIRMLGQTPATKFMHYARNTLIPEYWNNNTNKEGNNQSKIIHVAQAIALRYMEAWTVKGFELIWKDLCARKQSEIREIRSEIRKDPTTGARLFLKKRNIHAYQAGEVLFITRCQPIRPDTIYWNYTFHGECYMDIPIWAGHLFFGNSITGDLFTFSPKIPCNKVRPGVYWENGIYRTQEGRVSVSVIPLHMTKKKGWKSFTFSSPALVHDQSDSFRLSFTILQEYVSRFQSVSKTVDKLVNYTASIAYNPKAIRQALSGATQTLGMIIIDSGKALGTILFDFMEGVTNVVFGLVGDTFQRMINCLVLLFLMLVILACIFGCYKQTKRSDLEDFLKSWNWERRRQHSSSVVPPKQSSEIEILPSKNNSYPRKIAMNPWASLYNILRIKIKTINDTGKETQHPPQEKRVDFAHESMMPGVLYNITNELTPRSRTQGTVCPPPRRKRNKIPNSQSSSLLSPLSQSDLTTIIYNPTEGGSKAKPLDPSQEEYTKQCFYDQLSDKTGIFEPRPRASNEVREWSTTSSLHIKPGIHYTTITRTHKDVPGRHNQQDMNDVVVQTPPKKIGPMEKPMYEVNVVTGIIPDHSQLAYLQVIIENVLIRVLCDTGASISVIDRNVVLSNNWGPLLSDTRTEAKSASGHQLKVIGFIEPVITIGTRTFTERLMVVKNVGQVIFGGDVLAHCGMWSWDYPHQCFFSNEVQVMAPLTRRGVQSVSLNPPPRCVIAKENIEILPKTQVWFYGLASIPFPYTEAYFEPHQEIPYLKRISLQNTVISVNKMLDAIHVPVIAVNSTSKPVLIRKGTILGTIERLGKIPDSKLIQAIDQVKLAPPSLTIADVWKQINTANPTLPDEDLRVVKRFIQKYINKGVFTISDFDFGNDGLTRHKVGQESNSVNKQRPYSVPIPITQELDFQVKELLYQGIITCSISPENTSMILVRKTDNTYRICIDYRRLETGIETIVLSPLVGMDRPKGTAQREDHIFLTSALSLKTLQECGPPIMNQDPDELWASPSSTRHIPFSFQELSEQILCSTTDELIIVHMDDVLVFSNDGLEGYVIKLEENGHRMVAVNLKLEPAAYKALQQRCNDSEIRSEVRPIRIDSNTILECTHKSKIMGCDCHKVFRRLQYYHNFIPGFSLLAAPLVRLLQEHCSSNNGEQLPSNPKISLDPGMGPESIPDLFCSDFKKEFILYCNSSQRGISAILSQQGIDGKIRPIRFASKELNKIQRAYTMVEIEVFAIAWALNRFRPHFELNSVTIYAIEQVIAIFADRNEPRGRIAGWLLTLYDYQIILRRRSETIGTMEEVLTGLFSQDAMGNTTEEDLLTIPPYQIQTILATWLSKRKEYGKKQRIQQIHLYKRHNLI